jgi:citrate lyase beta subunit
MSEATPRPRRSLIFAPGNKPEMFPKALNSGADIVCVDLEDAIAPTAKDLAREATLKLFAETPADATEGVECMVRINSLRSPEGLADLLAILSGDRPPRALMLPKVKSPDEITLLAELLDGPRHRGIRFHVIIETNEGLEACHAIARASGRIDSLLFGGVDMAAELRVEPTWDALLHARATMVHAAAGAGLDLIDVPYLDLDDMAGLEREAAAAAALGMTGKGAIHPKQIPVVNRAFGPSPDAIARARRIVQAFEESDSGLVVVDNKLIEKPVLRSMHRILAIADKLGMTEN